MLWAMSSRKSALGVHDIWHGKDSRWLMPWIFRDMGYGALVNFNTFMASK